MGAREEAKRIVDEYTPIIMRIGYTYLGSKEDAENICQETLFKLVRRIPPFDDREREKAWVIRVAVNACKDHLKSAARRRHRTCQRKRARFRFTEMVRSATEELSLF